MKKFIHQFKAGDLVRCHGALFRITKDARESVWHRPQAGHLQTAFGPSDTARAESVWVSGEIVPGYFGPGQSWTFQGNFRAGLYSVE